MLSKPAWPWKERRIREFPIGEVASVNRAAESPPADAGLKRADVDAIWGATLGMYKSRLYPAIALCLRRRGVVVLDRAIGHVRGNAPGASPQAARPLAKPSTLFNLFSSSKLVTAMLVHLLDQRGQLHLDDPVCEYFPEFTSHGKDKITIRHILTHKAGIPTVHSSQMEIDLLVDPDYIRQILCDAKPMWIPGRRLAYHPLTGGFVLGEVIERITGGSIQDFLVSQISTPLGLDHFRFGVAPSDVSKPAENAFTGIPLPRAGASLFRRAIGIDYLKGINLSNDPRFLTGVVPAGNLITTADQACRFMEMLLRGGELDGVRIFDPRTINRAVSEQSYLEIDATVGVPVRYGLGCQLGSDNISIFGLKTPRAFGHMGLTNVLMYADPERDLSACLMCSGKPFISTGVLRWLKLVNTIARRCPRDWGGGNLRAR